MGRLRRSVAAAATWPPLTRPGYLLATGLALLWGRMLGGRLHRDGPLLYVTGLPRWAFGRGGTTVGGVFLTRGATSPRVLAHEAIHREQWRRYGLLLIPLYLAAGRDPLRNRFEIEAGLIDGGYLPRRRPRDADPEVTSS